MFGQVKVQLSGIQKFCFCSMGLLAGCATPSMHKPQSTVPSSAYSSPYSSAWESRIEADISEVEHRTHAFLDNAFGLYNNLVETGGLEENSPLIQTQNSFADLLLALKSLEIHLAQRERLDESLVNSDQLNYAQDYVSAIITDLESMDSTGSIGSVLFHHLTMPVNSQALASGQALVLLDAVRQVAIEMRKISESVESLAQRGRTTAMRSPMPMQL